MMNTSSFAFCDCGQSLTLDNTTQSFLPDGSVAFKDYLDNIIFVRYASGVTVRRHPTFVLTRTASGDAWVSDRQGTWLRFN